MKKKLCAEKVLCAQFKFWVNREDRNLCGEANLGEEVSQSEKEDQKTIFLVHLQVCVRGLKKEKGSKINKICVI